MTERVISEREFSELAMKIAGELHGLSAARARAVLRRARDLVDGGAVVDAGGRAFRAYCEALREPSGDPD